VSNKEDSLGLFETSPGGNAGQQWQQPIKAEALAEDQILDSAT
jgi:hypothetical protein